MVSVALSRGYSYQSPLSSTTVQNYWSYTSTPIIRLYGAASFTLYKRNRISVIMSHRKSVYCLQYLSVTKQ